MILAHCVAGQTARFERYAANLLYLIAAGRKIEQGELEPFGKQLDEIYRNPFKKMESEMTAEEIRLSVVRKLTG